ncbi:uncharacterized protein NFIA_027090 [Aspergillus fischeri NRRL 181]|uniref:Uncharacterized protein n=1 Tax=Neosartorya fischeri (strain ATCC 1020 / DSM 3700 / CBS 544.65 / FGSC A1164 / JCM 1740 / NRRL 181 / WB 181) TaxID=331117 RepID=A1DCS5_NEOFI|nr:conserved hypothetical protein [Aspergillus fischeri NRRL 181]EAW19635.1 conserved hypothetical protein [Aspergillus fischeri NRRL 181]KAG2021897.1 hypothetical protein GB937_004447 [Aspergillus fischeri]
MEDQRRDDHIARRDEHIPQSQGPENNTHPLPSENPQSHELDSYTEACRDLEQQLKAQINLIKRHLGAVGTSQSWDASSQTVQAGPSDAMQGQPIASESSAPITPTKTLSASALTNSNTHIHTPNIGNTEVPVVTQGLVSPAVSTSSAATTCEAFPDYYESCEKNPPIVDKAHEAAYNYAISKVVEEATRFKKIDANVTNPPVLNAATDPVVKGRSATPSAKKALGTSQTSKNSSTVPMPPIRPPLTEAEIAERKTKLLAEMKAFIPSGNIPADLMRRFVAMTNAVLQMEMILFPRENTACQPKNLLSAQETGKIRAMTSDMIQYLTHLNNTVKKQVEKANEVAFVMAQIAGCPQASVYERYTRMAEVFNKNTKKPSDQELRLLTVFLDLYDTVIYTRFLTMRFNGELILEEILNKQRAQLSQLLGSLWDIHNHVIENYQKIINCMVHMKRNIVAPIYEEMTRSKELWIDRWNANQRALERELAQQEQDRQELAARERRST